MDAVRSLLMPPRVPAAARGRARFLAAGLLAQAALPSAYAQSTCPDWRDPHATVVEAGPGDDLAARVRGAASGTTVLLRPGVYRLGAALQFTRDDVTLRSATGRREDVVLDGDAAGAGAPSGFTAEIIAVSASRITLADLSVRHARHHAVHAYAPAGRTVAGLRLRNLHLSDCGQQIVKVNSNGGDPLHWVDSGTVECSFIGFADNSVMEPMAGGYYTGGIDIHGGRGWAIRANRFANIQREGRTMEHAVHLWSKSRDCVVEGNRFEDVYRAVGLGMKTEAAGLERRYPDGKGDSPYSDCIGALVRNNVVWNRPGIRLESGIEIMNALDAEVYHNTVYSAERPFSSIEYRWPGTRAVLKNNLVSHAVLRRDGAQAELGGNLEDAGASLFLDAARGGLRLAPGSAAIDKGVPLAPGKADADMDGDARDGAPDAGADEYRPVSAVRRPAGGRAPGSGADGRVPSPVLLGGSQGRPRLADGRAPAP